MLAEVQFHQGFRYRIDPNNPEDVFQHILSNGGCVRKVYNLYVDFLYRKHDQKAAAFMCADEWAM